MSVKLDHLNVQPIRMVESNGFVNVRLGNRSLYFLVEICFYSLSLLLLLVFFLIFFILVAIFKVEHLDFFLIRNELTAAYIIFWSTFCFIFKIQSYAFQMFHSIILFYFFFDRKLFAISIAYQWLLFVCVIIFEIEKKKKHSIDIAVGSSPALNSIKILFKNVHL